MSKKLEDLRADDRELWLRGNASSRFLAELEDLGWGVRQQIGLTEKIEEKFSEPSKQPSK